MLPLVIATLVLNAISALTCIALFYCYCCIPNRGLGLRLIVYLTVSDFIFHATWLIKNWHNQTALEITTFLFYASFNFSLMWAANIAYFTMRLIRNDNFSKTLAQVKISAVALGIFALLLAAAYRRHIFPYTNFIRNQFVGPDQNNWGTAATLLNDAVAVISLILTLVFNLMSISLLKKYITGASGNFKLSIGVLYRYAFVQCFTMGPSAIYSLITDINNMEIPVFYHIAMICLGLAGLANAVVYFFQRSVMIRESVIKKEGSFGHELSDSELTEVFPYV